MQPNLGRLEQGGDRLRPRRLAVAGMDCGLVAGGGYEGPGASPDRADAMVWALGALMLGRRRAEPRIRFL